MQTWYISDLDGTLLNPDGKLSRFTEEALTKMLQKGLFFTIATGRTPLSVKQLFSKVPLTLPTILLNGALIFDFFKETAIDYIALTAEQKKELQRMEKRLSFSGLQVIVSNQQISFVFPKESKIWSDFFHNNNLKQSTRIWAQQPFFYERKQELLYAIYADQKPDRLGKMYTSLKNGYGLELDFYRDKYLPEAWFLEVYSKDASKGNALKKLRNRYAIEKVVAFGDSNNDISFFEDADFCCAVENAPENLVQKANVILPKDDPDRVVHYLLEHWKGNEDVLLSAGLQK